MSGSVCSSPMGRMYRAPPASAIGGPLGRDKISTFFLPKEMLLLDQNSEGYLNLTFLLLDQNSPAAAGWLSMGPLLFFPCCSGGLVRGLG